MPQHEAIVSTVLPQQVEKPIPTRTVQTRTAPRKNLNQPATGVEAQAAESAPAAESVKLSPQVTALARKEQAHRLREQALKQREKDLEERLALADKYSQLEGKLKAKDLSPLEELGVDYSGYTEYQLNKTTGEDPAAQKFKAMEDEIQALKKGQEDSATEEYEETVAEYRAALSKLASEDPRFAKVNRFKEEGDEGKEVSGTDIALQLILDSWEEDQKEVSLEDALGLTDKYLTERAKKWAALIDEPKTEEAESQALPPPKPALRTLTQTMQPSGTSARPQKSLQHMSDEERYAEARRRALEKNPNLRG